MSLHETLAALAETQLHELSASSPPLDDPSAVAVEARRFVDAGPSLVRTAFDDVLALLETTAFLTEGKGFHHLTLGPRRAVLERLEGAEPWSTLVLLVEGITWLVIHARDAARGHVGFRLRTAAADPVDAPAPPRADLDADYDACVVGTGAGGSVVAWRLAEAGKRVLWLEAGAWRNPRELSTRDDRALLDLYKDGGAQPAFPTLDRVFRPSGVGMVNVLQARTAGGGPMVNNAIHFRMPAATEQRWRAEEDFPYGTAELTAAFDRVHGELDPNVHAVVVAAGARSRRYKEAALALGRLARELTVSLHDCVGCGGCNVGCRFGRKTGGIHGPRAQGAPRSHFERALAAGARLATGIEVRHLRHGLSRKVSALVVRDLEAGGAERTVRASRYVLAAGPIESSRILQRSGLGLPILGTPVGERFSGNLVSPVTALFDVPLAEDASRPDPGLQMCHFVDGAGHLQETFFHYPGSLAVALPKGLREHARVMRGYGRMAICGVVVPSGPHGAVDGQGLLKLAPAPGEHARMVLGIERIAETFIEAGASEVLPATRHDVRVRPATRDADLARMRGALRGPGDLILATPHPQGGNALRSGTKGAVVDRSFAVRGLDDVFVADASVFPSGCDVNPQMTVMALAHLAADRILGI